MWYNERGQTIIEKGVFFMKKIYKLLGGFFLGMAAIITVVGPASFSGIASEDMPKSMKNNR